MASEYHGESPAVWINRVVSLSLSADNNPANVWCDAVASAITTGLPVSAAVHARDEHEQQVAAGASNSAGDTARSALLERALEASCQFHPDEAYACAEYGSGLTRGEFCVLLHGEILELRSHVPLLTSLLAEVFNVRVAEPSARRDAILARLRPSQRPLLPLLTTGMSQRDISRVLGKSPHTVHDHTKMIYRALDVHSRVELASVWHGFPIDTPGPV